LHSRGASIIRVAQEDDWEAFLPEVDGICLTNGPGDPNEAKVLIKRIQALLTLDIPIFGICFGNQLLALALGAKVNKMKYGHRSVNQPVRDVMTGKCYITAQNHGYAVVSETLPSDCVPWFVNINDGSNEGIRHQSKPIYAVQFHPEAAPGPHDTAFLFDQFIQQVKEYMR
jgi:carbamoyl-phosphate synthase small subunit